MNSIRLEQDRVELMGAVLITGYVIGALAMYLQYVKPF